jgi:hypothetical protein
MLEYNEADVLVDELHGMYQRRATQPNMGRAREVGFYHAVIARVLATGDIKYLETSMRDKVSEMLIAEVAGDAKV